MWGSRVCEHQTTGPGPEFIAHLPLQRPHIGLVSVAHCQHRMQVHRMSRPAFRQGTLPSTRGCIRAKAFQWPAFPNFTGKAASAKPPARPELVERILELGERAGSQLNKAEKAELLQMVKELQVEQQGTTTTESELLSATWKLLCTTEQETLFIVKNAGVFGTAAGDVFQVIDVEAGRLQNVITFPPEGAFVVDSSLEVGGPQRALFKFKSAELQLPEGKKLGLPPFGQGWFDNVYVDEEVRIALDIRGDALVVRRDGPPRMF